MFGLIKRIFIGLFTDLVNGYNHICKVHFVKQSEMSDSTYPY